MKKISIILIAGVTLVLGYAWYAARQAQLPHGTDNSVGKHQVASGTIDLSRRNLSSISPADLDDATTSKLDVSYNRLTGALPAELRKLANLEVLLASDNAMTGIPAEIGQLSKLRIANFANNKLSGLPLEIGNLTQLETLDLRGNPNLSQHDLDLIQAKIPKTTILAD